MSTAQIETWSDSWLTPGEARAIRAHEHAALTELYAGKITPPRFYTLPARTPAQIARWRRRQKVRAALQTLRDIAKLAGLILAGVSIAPLAMAGIWLVWILFRA